MEANNIRPFRNNLSTQFNRFLNQPLSGAYDTAPANKEIGFELQRRLDEFTSKFKDESRRGQLRSRRDSFKRLFGDPSSNRSTAKPNRGALTSVLMTLLDKPTRAIGTILGTSLAEMLGASPYNTKGMRMQAGADLGLPGFARDLNASKDIPVPYRLSESKVKDDEATALMRRRLQMLREQGMYD